MSVEVTPTHTSLTERVEGSGKNTSPAASYWRRERVGEGKGRKKERREGRKGERGEGRKGGREGGRER